MGISIVCTYPCVYRFKKYWNKSERNVSPYKEYRVIIEYEGRNMKEIFLKYLWMFSVRGIMYTQLIVQFGKWNTSLVLHLSFEPGPVCCSDILPVIDFHGVYPRQLSVYIQMGIKAGI